MSGANLSPRQKMIGMMYLVLTALLALNISKDILDAFILVNNGLENTLVNYDEKNALLYGEFDAAKAMDPVKVSSYWEKAQRVKKNSKTLQNYINDLKSKLVKVTDGITQTEADTIHLKYVNNKDNYDIPTHLLIGQTEDGSAGIARELKNKLNEYKKSLLGLFSEEEQKTLALDLETNDIQTPEGMENWEMGNFYHTPLAASITILSKLQTDIKNAEFEVINKLFQSVTKRDFKFDKIEAKIIPNSNYVMLGEDYKADVFLAAFNTTQNPKILIGDYDEENNKLVSISDTVNVNNGLGKYVVKTNKEGIFSYEGLIKLTSPTGELQSYPFKSEYIVAKPSLVVSPDKMNVFYIGPKNPVSISVPGVASENIHATISGSGNKIKKIANGKYEVSLATSSPRNVDVAVNATMPDGSSRNMGKMTFVAKKLPKPYAEIGNISINKGEELHLQLISHRKIKAKYDNNFIFQGLPLKVVKFKIEIWRGSEFNGDKNFTNENFTQEVKNFLNRTRKKDVVYFTKIFAQDITGHQIRLNDVVIRVK